MDGRMKRKLVDEILAASFAMPDAAAHRAWLLGLDEGVLRARLEQLEREREHPPARGGLDWRSAARKKATASALLCGPVAQPKAYDPGL
jgi:hypothetical protein